MGDLVENPAVYPLTVYRIAATDPVMGWANATGIGIANLAAQNLADRTAYLKLRADALAASGGAGLIGNAPAGSISATTVQAAINELDTEKAPLASPILTGIPTAPTAAVGNKTTQIATTSFTRSAMAAFGIGGESAMSGLFNLNNAPIGGVISVNGLESDAVTYNFPRTGSVGTTPVWYNVLTYGTATRLTQVAVFAFSGANHSRTFAREFHDTAWTGWRELVMYDSLAAAGGAALIGNAPSGGLVATTVQAAIVELDIDKAPKIAPIFSGQAQFAEGTASAPSIAFVNDGAPDTGFYHVSDGIFGATCNTIPVALFTPSGVQLQGNPTAPTAPMADNDTSIATTAFVLANSNRYPNSAGVGVTANTTLAASQTGQWFEVQAAALTITFPPLASVSVGAGYTIRTIHDVTLKGNGAEAILAINSGNTFTLRKGMVVTICCNNNGWYILSMGFDSDSPVLTGNPTAPTAANGTKTTQLATTAFVATAVSSLIPAGTRMPFAQAAAPVGWVQDTSDSANNRMLRVVNTAGGGVAGTHSPIVNNVVPSHTHGFTTGNVSADHSHAIGDPGHAHGISDPGHFHDNGLEQTYANDHPGSTELVKLTGTYRDSGSKNSGTKTTGIGINGAGTGIWTGGINTNHTHSGSTDNGSSQTNWQPRYIDMIICVKS